mgnify:CR=1 FL=1
MGRPEVKEEMGTGALKQGTWLGGGLGLWLGLAGAVVAHPVHSPLQVEFPLVLGFETFYVDNDDAEYLADGGEILLGELNCVACHAPPEGWEDRMRAGLRGTAPL